MQLTSLPTKPVLFATRDLRTVSATRAAGHISAGTRMKGCGCLALNDFPEAHLSQTCRNPSPPQTAFAGA